jgi:membrane protein implicated in regulation of membrane protease activity
MFKRLCRSRVSFVIAYVVLGAADFAYFLHSPRLSNGLAACVFLFLAVGWNRWFRRLDKENEVTRLNLGAPTKPNHG